MNQMMTLDYSSTTAPNNAADPRFVMYNREAIKSHLEKRRRRAQSNIRPRQRFSTITAFHKNDIAAVSNHQPEDGISAANSKCSASDFGPRIPSDLYSLLCASLYEATKRHGPMVRKRAPESASDSEEGGLLPHHQRLHLGPCLHHPAPVVSWPRLT